MRRRIGPCVRMCEDQCLTWRRARENVASVLSRVLATPVCNGFPGSPQDKGALRISTICSLSPLSFQPLTPFSSLSSQFHICLFLLLTSFKQTQKKSCWTPLPGQNPFISVLPYSSSTLESVHGCVSLCERAVLQPELLS